MALHDSGRARLAFCKVGIDMFSQSSGICCAGWIEVTRPLQGLFQGDAERFNASHEVAIVF
jgi:hypothetical protein